MTEGLKDHRLPLNTNQRSEDGNLDCVFMYFFQTALYQYADLVRVPSFVALTVILHD